MKVFNFLEGSIILSALTFILLLLRRKDPDLTLKLLMVRFKESGKLVLI